MQRPLIGEELRGGVDLPIFFECGQHHPQVGIGEDQDEDSGDEPAKWNGDGPHDSILDRRLRRLT